MRFDDSLQTVLAADSSTPSGAAVAWRQLVDLIGRGRAPATGATLTLLRELRADVPRDVRAASGRSLAFGQPPAGLVRLFAEDEPAVAAPVLRTATIAAAEWNALLADLSPGGRSILRHRRDLPAATTQALAAFGAVDFVLPQPEVAKPEAVEPVGDVPAPAPPQLAPESDFITVGALTQSLPALARLREVEAERSAPLPETVERFEIAELVARIDAFQRGERPPADARQAELFALEPPVAAGFRFETDADGMIRWVAGAERAALVGLSLARPAPFGASGVDAAAAGAFRQRADIADARLAVVGRSDAAGQWRVNAVAGFDRASGRFTGYRGAARRPRGDEWVEPDAALGSSDAGSIRQLVHELRTPINAIAGFAEMIETQMLGKVKKPYRGYAGDIRRHADTLLAGIDDLDMAARAESGALELRPTAVGLDPLLRRIVADLAPLAELRRAAVAITGEAGLAVTVDERATERLLRRLLATLLGAAAPGETIRVDVQRADGEVGIRCDRPQDLLDSGGDEAPGASLLGADFALRLAGRLAREQRGALDDSPRALTLRLPAAFIAPMEQATTR